jgi:hypothetical protein
MGPGFRGTALEGEVVMAGKGWRSMEGKAVLKLS